MIVHVHDIFLPSDYPRDAVLSNLCFWSEQYLLQAFLTFNPQFEVLWGSSAMQCYHPDVLLESFPRWEHSYRDMPKAVRQYLPTRDRDRVWPSSFWMRRVTAFDRCRGGRPDSGLRSTQRGGRDPGATFFTVTFAPELHSPRLYWRCNSRRRTRGHSDVPAFIKTVPYSSHCRIEVDVITLRVSWIHQHQESGMQVKVRNPACKYKFPPGPARMEISRTSPGPFTDGRTSG